MSILPFLVFVTFILVVVGAIVVAGVDLLLLYIIISSCSGY